VAAGPTPLQPVAAALPLRDLPQADFSIRDGRDMPRTGNADNGKRSGKLMPGRIDLDQRKVARATYELPTNICEREDQA